MQHYYLMMRPITTIAVGALFLVGLDWSYYPTKIKLIKHNISCPSSWHTTIFFGYGAGMAI